MTTSTRPEGHERSRPHSLLAFLCSVFKVHPNDRTRTPEEDVGVDRSWPRDRNPSAAGWLNAFRLAIRTTLTGHPSGLSMYRLTSDLSSGVATLPPTGFPGGLMTIAEPGVNAQCSADRRQWGRCQGATAGTINRVGPFAGVAARP